MNAAVGLDFDNDAIADHHVGTEVADKVTAKPDLQRHLSGDWESGVCQRHRERGLIHPLEKALTEFRVHIEEDADDPSGEIFVE
jgi:hypothetical protein